MEGKSQKANRQSKVKGSGAFVLRVTCYALHVTNPAICNLQSAIANPWTLDFRLWTSFVLLWLLLVPAVAAAQKTSGGWTISLYGVVQVEPGPDVVTLEVKDEKIRFAIQNVQCSDRGFSTGRFMLDITHKDPGLHIRGSEEWLELLIKEPPSKRTLQMTGVYYQDSRMFVLNKLGRFSGSPGPR